MTVQGKVAVNENNSTNWLLPAGGLAVGAGAGAWKAPAKYSSFDELVEAATKGDKFEMPKVADGADDAAKKDFKTVTDAVENRKTQDKALAELFTGDTKEVEFKKVLDITKQGEVTADKIAAAKKNEALAKIISGMTKDADIDITDDMKNIVKTGKEGENLDDAVKTLWKDVTGKEFPSAAEGAKPKVTDDMIKAAKTNAENATKYLTENKAAAELIESAQNGKVTKDAAEQFIKSGSEAATKAFDNVKGMFGKNMWKGAAIWGAVGLAAGWVISKFMGGSKEA